MTLKGLSWAYMPIVWKERLYSANVLVMLLFISAQHVNIDLVPFECAFVTSAQLRYGNAATNWHGHKKSCLYVENN